MLPFTAVSLRGESVTEFLLFQMMFAYSILMTLLTLNIQDIVTNNVNPHI
jgi:hypothetical protein